MLHIDAPKLLTTFQTFSGFAHFPTNVLFQFEDSIWETLLSESSCVLLLCVSVAVFQTYLIWVDLDSLEESWSYVLCFLQLRLVWCYSGN